MQCTFDNLEKTVFILSRNKKASTPKVAAVRRSHASSYSSLFIIAIVALLYWTVRFRDEKGYNIEELKIAAALTVLVIAAVFGAKYSLTSGMLRRPDGKLNSLAGAAFGVVVLFIIGMPIWMLDSTLYQQEAGLVDAIVVFVFQAWYLSDFTRPRKNLPTETSSDDGDTDSD